MEEEGGGWDSDGLGYDTPGDEADGDELMQGAVPEDLGPLRDKPASAAAMRPRGQYGRAQAMRKPIGPAANVHVAARRLRDLAGPPLRTVVQFGAESHHASAVSSSPASHASPHGSSQGARSSARSSPHVQNESSPSVRAGLAQAVGSSSVPSSPMNVSASPVRHVDSTHGGRAMDGDSDLSTNATFINDSMEEDVCGAAVALRF